MVSIVFRRLAVKWQDQILEMFNVDTLNFVNLIEFLKTKEEQKDYKGLLGMKSGTSQNSALTWQVPLNSRTMKSFNSDVYNRRNRASWDVVSVKDGAT